MKKIYTLLLLSLCLSFVGYSQCSLVKDIKPGATNSNPLSFKELNGKVIFMANGTVGQEPYITDGTSENTLLVKDVNPTGNGFNSAYGVTYNNYMYFFGDDGVHGLELWRTDGSLFYFCPE